MGVAKEVEHSQRIAFRAIDFTQKLSSQVDVVLGPIRIVTEDSYIGGIRKLRAFFQDLVGCISDALQTAMHAVCPSTYFGYVTGTSSWSVTIAP